MKKFGYTLIEAMVVMTIIAVLTALSLAGLFATRNAATIDAEAEKLLTVIRDAQNNSVAVNKDASGGETRIWGVHIDEEATTTSGSYRLISFDENAAGQLVECQMADSSPCYQPYRLPGLDIAITKWDYFGLADTAPSGTYGGISNGFININYSTPFGRFYITEKKNCLVMADDGCEYKKNPNLPNDFIMSDDTGDANNSTANHNYVSPKNLYKNQYRITLTYKNLTRNIRINSAGDAYIE